MTDQELGALFNDLESDRVKYKASDSDRSKMRQAVCAFANNLPNYQRPEIIVVRAHDDDGSCANFPVTDGLKPAAGVVRSHISAV